MTQTYICRHRGELVSILRPILFIALLVLAHKAGAQGAEGPFVSSSGPLNLLQPLDDETGSLEAEPGIDIFFTYFNLSWPLIVGSAAGVGVLQSLYGGVQIMLSGSDSGKLEEGKSRLLWALAGLLMIGLSGMILETLNPVFFVQS